MSAPPTEPAPDSAAAAKAERRKKLVGRLVVIGLGLLIAVTRPWRNWPKDAPLLPMAGLGLATAGAILFY